MSELDSYNQQNNLYQRIKFLKQRKHYLESELKQLNKRLEGDVLAEKMKLPSRLREWLLEQPNVSYTTTKTEFGYSNDVKINSLIEIGGTKVEINFNTQTNLYSCIFNSNDYNSTQASYKNVCNYFLNSFSDLLGEDTIWQTLIPEEKQLVKQIKAILYSKYNTLKFQLNETQWNRLIRLTKPSVAIIILFAFNQGYFK